MDNMLKIEAKPIRHYIVTLRDGGQIRVRANSFSATDAGMYSFYLETGEMANKGFLKCNPPVPIYESHRREIASVEEEGYVERLPRVGPVKPKKAAPKKKVAPNKSVKG